MSRSQPNQANLAWNDVHGRKQGIGGTRFHLGDVVPELTSPRFASTHRNRGSSPAEVTWCRRSVLLSISPSLASELAPHYSSMARPSIDPELMVRMLIVGYVFALRSERLICREVQVNLAYRRFCKLGLEELRRIIRHSRVPETSGVSRGDWNACATLALVRHS
jgi:hypothetical protein